MQIEMTKNVFIREVYLFFYLLKGVFVHLNLTKREYITI